MACCAVVVYDLSLTHVLHAAEQCSETGGLDINAANNVCNREIRQHLPEQCRRCCNLTRAHLHFAKHMFLKAIDDLRCLDLLSVVL